MGQQKSISCSLSDDRKDNKHSRRELFRAVAPCCALLAAGGNRAATSDAGESKREGGDVKLCTPCGIYCGACDIYNNNVAGSAGKLKRILDSYGYTFKGVEGIEESYPEFKKVLAYIVNRFKPGVSCRCGCENGIPDCPIRKCASEKGVETCARCSDFPCEKLDSLDRYYGIVAELRKQKERGLQAWADKMAAKVAEGWAYTDLLTEK